MATTSKLYTQHASTGTKGAEITSVYFVNVDSAMSAKQVIAEAQSVPAGEAVPAVGADFEDQVGSTGTDDSIIVDDIKAEQRESGPTGRLKWKVTVTYRNPTLSGSRPGDIDLPPNEREARFWTESLVITEERDQGYNLTEIKWPWAEENSSFGTKPATRGINTLGPITNAAGERFGTADRIKRRLPIFVYKKNVLSPFEWIAINNNFEAKTNEKPWDIFGESTTEKADPQTCLFWSIETSRPMYWGSVVYYELEVRVLYDPGKHLIEVPNEGSRYWEVTTNEDTAKSTSILATPYANGQPMQPPIMLDSEGGFREDQGGIAEILKFRDLETANFDQLTAQVVGV